jgi:hypothetical protein
MDSRSIGHIVNWTSHPAIKGFRPVNGCLAYTGSMSAEDFLKHYVEMIANNGLHVVGPMALGAAYEQRVAGVAQNMNGISPNIHGSADAAAVRVETVNGTFIIEQRLRAYVECRITTSGPDAKGGGCSAHVDVERRGCAAR